MPGSVTQLLGQVKVGDDEAADELWNIFIRRLEAVARNKIPPRFRRVADEEDIAHHAFGSFLRGVKENKFARLDNRGDMWRLVVDITNKKAWKYLEYLTAEKRGGGQVRGDSVFQNKDGSAASGYDASACRPIPLEFQPCTETGASEFESELSDEVERLLGLLGNQKENRVAELRKIALWKLAGFTNRQIAEKLKCGATTVDRKVRFIRERWAADTSVRIMRERWAGKRDR